MAINFRCHAPIASLASRLSRPALGLSVEPFGFHCQPATLIIGKTHAAVADLLPQHTIFLHQIFDDLLLPLIHPTGDRYDEKGKWIQTRLHVAGYHARENALSASKPRQSSFWMVRGAIRWIRTDSMGSNRSANASFSSRGEISATSRTSLSLCLPDLLDPTFGACAPTIEMDEFRQGYPLPPASALKFR